MIPIIARRNPSVTNEMRILYTLQNQNRWNEEYGFGFFFSRNILSYSFLADAIPTYAQIKEVSSEGEREGKEKFCFTFRSWCNH